jgi:hypothetical protein
MCTDDHNKCTVPEGVDLHVHEVGKHDKVLHERGGDVAQLPVQNGHDEKDGERQCREKPHGYRPDVGREDIAFTNGKEWMEVLSWQQKGFDL